MSRRSRNVNQPLPAPRAGDLSTGLQARLDDEKAGALESYIDADLYDWEYRRRRRDVNFYRLLARERLSATSRPQALDIACGSGRLLLPLLRDGHSVTGLDHAAAMLARASARVAKLPLARRSKAQLVRADMRQLPFAARRFAFVACPFHSVQHLLSDDDLLAFFKDVRRVLLPDGWFVFDVLPRDPDWLKRDPNKRWARTSFRHPTTGERFVYTTNHVHDARTDIVHIRVYYQPVDNFGAASGVERVVRLSQRQLQPSEVQALLGRAGLHVIARYSDFDLAMSDRNAPFDEKSYEHVYLARPLPAGRQSDRQ